MATALSVRPNRLAPGPTISGPPVKFPNSRSSARPMRSEPWRSLAVPSRRTLAAAARAGSRADDSAPFENALRLLGVSEDASFDEVLRAKNSIVANVDDDQDAIAQVEAAYDMLLMRSLTQRREGKVVDNSIRYADVKSANTLGMGLMLPWLQANIENLPVSVETPSTSDLGIQAGVYGAMIALTYVNGASTSSVVTHAAGADVPGLILAASFGASLYFMTKKNVKLGKAVAITVGGLMVGAVVGSAIENWLQVDIVPFLGLHSPAAVVSEVVLISQFLGSLYLR